MNDDLKGVAEAVDGLVVLTRSGLTRAVRLVLVCGALLVASAAAQLWTHMKLRDQVQTNAELAAKVELLIAEQAKTRQITEKTAAKVDEQADDQRPTVEIVPVPAASGKKASAVVVIKPRKPPPTAGADAGSPAAAPIEIPVKLPEGSKVQEKL